MMFWKIKRFGLYVKWKIIKFLKFRIAQVVLFMYLSLGIIFLSLLFNNILYFITFIIIYTILYIYKDYSDGHWHNEYINYYKAKEKDKNEMGEMGEGKQ